MTRISTLQVHNQIPKFKIIKSILETRNQMVNSIIQKQPSKIYWGGETQHFPGYGARFLTKTKHTVSQICNLICFPSMVIMRAPNSTPMVKSCTGWNRLSVNCNSRHDFPTPRKKNQTHTQTQTHTPKYIKLNNLDKF